MTAFPAIRVEGGLLGLETLDQLLAAELPGQRVSDFGLDARRNLTDEIAAAFADARALWGVFQHRLERLAEDDPATTETRDFWTVPLFRLLGYAPQYNPRAQEIDGQSFWVFYRADEAEDAPPMHIVGARQELGRVPASGRPRLAPHSLVQEYLNRTEHVWGVVTNGLVLRLLRNSTLVRRQAYVEFDLRSILAEQRFNDFQALYRLLHRTRLPDGTGAECLLDKYYAQSEKQGDRVRKNLRYGVEECIKRLANSFLHLQANESLRRRLSPQGAAEGRLDAKELYRQLLRLIYRFLFLLVSEDRGLLSTDPVYVAHYGITRLRRLLDHRAAYTTDDDLCHSLRVLWRVSTDDKLARVLRLPPLNGELFAPVDLDHCTITNRELLEAFWHLSYQERTAPPRRVNYSALDVEELGSVYESLLDFHPLITDDEAGRPVFDLVEGSERKTTGSYYTPHELVAEIVKSALDPVIADRLAAAPAGEREKALLSIRVCDPACGSGHFLLAAARRLGQEIARQHTGEDEPAPERVREWTREAIAHCIYGVDKNPLAVDLCRVALWLESHTGDKPLTFLDHRIRCGDALVGVFDLAILKDGIPDNAFNPLEGDDRETARALKRRNRSERSGQRELLDWQPEKSIDSFADLSRTIDGIGDDTPEAVREKKRLFAQGHADTAWQRICQACDVWTAAFFQPLAPGKPVITTAALLDHLDGRQLSVRLTDLAFELSELNGFFHWPLEFPEVFAAGGFDVVVGNPPWDKIQPEEIGFFDVLRPDIAHAESAKIRKARIAQLKETDPANYLLWQAYKQSIDATCRFLSASGRVRFSSVGNLNTYRLFTETCSSLIKQSGRAGLVIQTGLATDESGKELFNHLLSQGRIVRFWDFENRKKLFRDVDSRFRFSLITLRGAPKIAALQGGAAQFAWLLHSLDDALDPKRILNISSEDIALFNPDSGTCPVFSSQADLAVARIFYKQGIHVSTARSRFEDIDFLGELFNLTRDGEHFLSPKAAVGTDVLPLYEAKYMHQFDHRFATVVNGAVTAPDPTLKTDTNFRVATSHVVTAAEVHARLRRRGISSNWLCGFRDIASPTNERTAIAAVLPVAAIGNSINLILGLAAAETALLLANVNTFAFDYVCRQKVGGTHVNIWIFKQLPVIPLERYESIPAWLESETIGDWILHRVNELVYTANDLESFANGCNWDRVPFIWNEQRRFEIRCELDAAFFKLYLPAEPDGAWGQLPEVKSTEVAELRRHFPTPRDAVAYVLDQFPIVRQRDEQLFEGHYRTKERILAIYDAILVSIRSGAAYRTSLDPPPGTPVSGATQIAAQ
jgi:hypothetical protein